MLVMKFGGSSVEDAVSINRVSDIILSRIEQVPLVVVSATGKTTDELVALGQHAASGRVADAEELIEWIVEKHRKICSDLGLNSDKSLDSAFVEAISTMRRTVALMSGSRGAAAQLKDELLSVGEHLSANILAANLRFREIDAEWFDSRIAVTTDSKAGSAAPDFELTGRNLEHFLSPRIAAGKVFVMQGFVGSDSTGRTTTMGRGGSDYSATILASLLQAEKVEIWTDVDGIMTADPYLVKNARSIPEMTFQEAAELAYFGAKVLHPSTIKPAVERGIPVYVLNSRRPREEGTVISPTGSKASGTATVVKSVAYKEGLSILTIKSTRMLMAYGFMSSIFQVFDKYQTSVVLVSTSEVSVSVTLDDTTRLDEICRELNQFSEVEVSHEKAIVCVVGENIGNIPGMPARVFRELDDIRVGQISQGASEINISFVINENELPKVINRLHECFFPQAGD
jgi:aspartate kinase